VDGPLADGPGAATTAAPPAPGDTGADDPVWLEVLNTDATVYGGSGVGNMGRVQAEPVPYHGRRWSAEIRVPPLGALVLTPAPR
ncbi:hypothetical protein HLB15_22940, partial [Promicromonospora citrea]